MEASVVDRDSRVQCEHLDEPLVFLTELPVGLLVREVQAPNGTTLGRHRNSEQRMHRRVVRREAVAARVCGNVGDAQRTALADDHAQQAVAARQRPDPLPVGATDAARYEALDPAFLVHDSQGGVLGSRQFADPIRDELENSVEIQDAGNAAGGRI